MQNLSLKFKKRWGYMISNKIKLILSGILIISFLFIFVSSGKSSFNPLNIGLFIIFALSFITSLVNQVKDKK